MKIHISYIQKYIWRIFDNHNSKDVFYPFITLYRDMTFLQKEQFF